MAVPTDPTITTLVTEGWKKTGVTPSATEITRASTEFLQEIFNDIWNRSVLTGNTRLKTLQTKTTSISVKGTRTLDLAEDFDEEFSVVILDGTIRGTAQTGTTTSITLASDEDELTATRGLGKYVYTTGGTGSNQLRQTTLYNATTKLLTVDSTWTAPASNTTYLIVEKVHYLDEDNMLDEQDYYLPAAAGIPSYYSKYGRQLIFDRPFDLSTYGILIRYYQNLNQVDLTEGSTTLITRILRNWQAALKQGIYWKVCQTQNDTQEPAAKKEYDQLVSALLVKEIPYGGEFVGFTL